MIVSLHVFMKEIVKKISAFTLSLIVLLSSMSFTIEKHFCGGELMDISYFGEADGCDMDDLSTVSSYEVVKENSCCVDETQIVESTTFDKERITKVTQKNIEFVAFFAYSYINIFNEVLLEEEPYKEFSPPDIIQDIQVFHQSFLI